MKVYNLINIYKKLDIRIKSVFWFTMCNILNKGISLISVPVFTRIMTANEYGLLSTFMTFESFVLVFATWEIPTGVYQKGIYKYKNEKREFSISCQLFSNLITIFIFGIIYFSRSTILNITRMDLKILGYMFVYFMLWPGYNMWLVEKRSNYEYRKTVAVSLIYSISNVAMPIVAMLLLERTANIKYRYALITSIVMWSIFYVKYIRYDLVLKKKLLTYFKYIINFQLPCLGHSLSLIVLNSSDKIMILNMVGEKQAAYYSIAYSLAIVISIFQSSLNQVMVPWRYEMLEEKKYTLIRKTTNMSLWVIAGIIFLFILLAPEVMKLLFTQEYYEAVWCIPAISVSIFFVYLYTNFTAIEMFFEDTRYVFWISCICSLLNVILNFLFINNKGYVVCSYTTLVSYVVFAICHYVVAKIICKKREVSEKVFDEKNIFLLSCCMVMIAFFVSILYKYLIIRYIVLLAIGGLFWFNKHKVFLLLENIRKSN